MDTDVLVVGAGPTGLMLANQLVRRGVRVHIIDRHPGPSVETRALGVQARTMEIYSKLGIVDRALELGKRGTGANIWAQGRKMARVPLGEAGQNASYKSKAPISSPQVHSSRTWSLDGLSEYSWRRSSKSQKLIPCPESDAPVHVAGDAYSIPASLGGWFLSIQSVLEKACEDHEFQSK